MDMKAMLKKRAVRKILSYFLLVSALTFVATTKFLGPSYSVESNGALISPISVVLHDVQGNSVMILGNYRMDLMRINAFEEWLKANGFSPVQTGEDSSSITMFRGMYKESLPITLTIESKETPEEATVNISYNGSGFKRLLDKRVKLVHVFSNKVVEQCTNNIVF